MNRARWILLASLLAAAARAKPAAVPRSTQQKAAGTRLEQPGPERAIAGIVQDLQLNLESASSGGFLSNIDKAKFADYSLLEEMIQRLVQEDDIRVYFRQAGSSIQRDHAQITLDAAMELTRKNSAGQLQRRQRRIVLDFERSAHGWKIVGITPRDFFRPF